MGGSGCPYGLREQKPLTVIFIRTVGTRYAIQTQNNASQSILSGSVYECNLEMKNDFRERSPPVGVAP